MFEKLKTRKALLIYGICVLGAAFLCVTVRTVAILFFFDIQAGYYESGVISAITGAIPVIAVIAAGLLTLIPALRVEPTLPQNTKHLGAVSIFPALGFAVFAVTYILHLIDFSNYVDKIPLTYILCAVTSVGACVYFGLKLFGYKGEIFNLITALMTAIWLLLALINCYFDTTVPMNAPMKYVFLFACLAALLLTVNEMRVGIDTTRVHFHLFSASAAAILLPLSAVPSLIAYFSNNAPYSYTLVYDDIVLLCISVFAITRLVQMCFCNQTPLTAVSEDNTDPVDIGDDSVYEEPSDTAEANAASEQENTDI